MRLKMLLKQLASKLSSMSGKYFASSYGRIGHIVKNNEEFLILKGLEQLSNMPKLIYYTPEQILNILQRYISIEKNKNEVQETMNDLNNWINCD